MACTSEIRKYSSKIESLVEKGFIKKGYRLISRNKKYFGVEVDRHFISQNGQWILCEVKSLQDWCWFESRISKSQTQRLNYVRIKLQAKHPEAILLYYAFYVVSQKLVVIYDNQGNLVWEFAANLAES